MLRSVIIGLASLSALLGVYIGVVELNLQVLERRESGPALSAEAWEHSFRRAQQVANWAPQHAAAQDLVARMAQRGAGEYSGNPSEAIRLHQMAVKYGHKSLRIRPAWAATWLNLAASEFVLNANGSEWRQALEQVFKIHDRNLRSQIALATFRKQVHSKLNPAQQRQFQIASAQAQFDYGFDFTMAVIRLSRPYWVCPSSFAREVAISPNEFAKPGNSVEPDYDQKPSFDPKKTLSASMIANINSVCEAALN